MSLSLQFLDPMLTAPLQIQIHASAALTAIATGPVALFGRKRGQLHKAFGYVWMAAMLIVATTSFLIHSFAVIGPFSPLHGFALLTFWSLWTGLRHARAGRIRQHRATFRGLYWFGLLVAGLANFLPGRRINQLVFGGQDELGWIVVGLGGVALGALLARERLSSRATLPSHIAA